MYRLVALTLLLSASTAHAQYAPPYAPYPPAYPPPGPIYIPEPGHPASDAPDAAPRYAPQQSGYGYAAPAQPYGAPPTELTPPPFPPPQASPPQQAYAAPGAVPARPLLAAQNAVRAAVGDPPLRWSNRLAGVARQWANHLVATGEFQHHLGDKYGENLYEMTGGTASPRQVVAAWADEARNYDLRDNTCSGVCGHYTQIVWRTTRTVGCAVADGADRQVWVCEYDPAGNWVGYRPY